MERSAMLKAYKNVFARNDISIIYDGSDPNEDSGVFFVIQTDNPDNPNEPKYTFYEIFPGAPLSIDGFEQTVLKERDYESFMKMAFARIKGCTITKSEVLCCLLGENYLIDDIYVNGSLMLKKPMLKEVSAWVNFKGGLHAKSREEIRAEIAKEKQNSSK